MTMMVDTNAYFIAIGILFVIFTSITFIFSSITIITIVINWKSQCRSITNLLSCNSSATLFFYAIGISIQLPFYFQIDQQQPNLGFCRISAFIYVFACAVKSLSYLVQAISRWFITIHYRHRNLLRFRTNIFIIITSWLVGLIAAVCLLFFPQAYQYESESRLCVLTSKVFLTSFIPAMTIFFIPASTIILLYGIIVRHTIRVYRTHPKGFMYMTNKRNIQVYRNILIIIGIVLISGTPYFMSVIINGITKGPWVLYSMAVVFIALAAAMESIAIFFTSNQVRKVFYKKVCCRQKRKIAAVT
jgi:hypothetical protein